MKNKVLGYDSYKPVRNLIRQFDRGGLLYALVTLNYEASLNPQQRLQQGYLTWELLASARWTIREWNNIRGSKSPRPENIAKLLNKIKEFANVPDPILNNGGKFKVFKIMRKMAFQQFWIQESISQAKAGRAIYLFIHQKIPEFLERVLKEKYGAKAEDLYDFYFILWAYFHKDEKKKFIKKGYFSGVENKTHGEKLEMLLRKFSLRPSDFDSFNSEYPPQNYYNEIFEVGPLQWKPLLEIDDHYYLWNWKFLQNFLEFGIYDLLKMNCPNELGNFFGPRFEEYLKKRLKDCGLSFLAEQDLKKMGFKKQVDFVLESKNARILIEAKGIEAHKTAKILPEDDVMVGRYKENILKALDQANYVVKKFDEKIKKTNFILVTTYKDLFLGNGEDAWEEFLKNGLESEYGIVTFNIDPRHLFFLSVDDFDHFLAESKGDADEMSSILFRVARDNETPPNKKFIFRDYLSKDESKNEKFLREVFGK